MRLIQGKKTQGSHWVFKRLQKSWGYYFDMKIWGIVFIVFGVFWTVAGFLSYKSDIQLGIAVTGICMAGIGGVLVALSSIKKDLMSIWLWVKEIEKK